MMKKAIDALQLVLLFHRGGAWTAQDGEKWTRITGSSLASTKSLCDHIRDVIHDLHYYDSEREFSGDPDQDENEPFGIVGNVPADGVQGLIDSVMDQESQGSCRFGTQEEKKQ